MITILLNKYVTFPEMFILGAASHCVQILFKCTSLIKKLKRKQPWIIYIIGFLKASLFIWLSL